LKLVIPEFDAIHASHWMSSFEQEMENQSLMRIQGQPENEPLFGEPEQSIWEWKCPTLGEESFDAILISVIGADLPQEIPERASSWVWMWWEYENHCCALL
jgi:hypothetical protein